MYICDAQDRVWIFHRDCLWNLGRADFKDNFYSRPHIAIKHILFRLRPSYIKTRMKNIIIWMEDKNLINKIETHS